MEAGYPISRSVEARHASDRDLGRGYRGHAHREPAAAGLWTRDAQITVVDQDDAHVYQPGSALRALRADPPRGHRPAPGRQLHGGIEYRTTGVDHVDDRPARGGAGRRCDPPVRRARRGHRGGAGARGDRGADRHRVGWSGSSPSTHPKVPPASSAALREFDHGRLVVNVVEMPIKCPVAPLEFCFLADWFLRERGVRDARRRSPT